MHVLQTVLPTRGARIPIENVAMERWRQHEKWGEQHYPNGTSDSAEAKWQADFDRQECEDAAKDGTLTWRHIAQEEISEAFAETDPAKLRAELVQAAAVLCSWIEDIDNRPSTPQQQIKHGLAYIQDKYGDGTGA